MPTPNPIQFKFSHSVSGYARRATFQHQPTWQALAAKIESLYSIPLDKVGVSYIDADNDEITLSSDEELQDYYQASHQPGQIIKFEVLDLSSTRDAQKSLPRTPPTARSRNTFGIQEENPFEFEEWQRIPGIRLEDLFASGIPESESPSPHAFVEVLDSDVSSLAKGHVSEQETDDDDASTVHPHANTSEAPLDKGKGKVMSLPDITSTSSLLAGSSSEKPPIHVYDMGAQVNGNALSSNTPSFFAGSNIPIVAESTPKSQTQDLHPAESESGNPDLEAKAAPPPDEVADPPLPSLENTAPPNVSLSNDVATVLNTLSNIVATHPELSEGLRNIVRNAANGTYWHAHREALSQAANDIAQTAGESAQEIRRNAEEEAGRRVAEALGGIFRSFSHITDDAPAGPSNNDPLSSNAAYPPGMWFGGYSPGSRSLHHPWRPRSFGPGMHRSSWGPWWNPPPPNGASSPPLGPPPRRPGPPPAHGHVPPPPPANMPPPGPPPPGPPPPGPPPSLGPLPPGPPPPSGPLHVQGSPSPSPATRGLPVPPIPAPLGPPPGPSHERGLPYPPHGPLSSYEHPPSLRPPPPPPHNPPPFGQPPPAFGFPPPHGPPHHHGHPFSAPHHGGPSPRGPTPHGPPRGLPHPHGTYSPSSLAPNRIESPCGPDQPHRSSPQELRAQVEAAKQHYKAEKERYRREREERKLEKEKERKATVTRDAGQIIVPAVAIPEAGRATEAPAVVQTVSKARGPFPELELYSVRRHNTHPGHGPARRIEKTSDDLMSRALARITKRLSDMGFTENGYPGLPMKIKARMPDNGVTSKDEEDTIVTVLLEELLAMSPRPPVASGSGLRIRENNVPGAWH